MGEPTQLTGSFTFLAVFVSIPRLSHGSSKSHENEENLNQDTDLFNLP